MTLHTAADASAREINRLSGLAAPIVAPLLAQLFAQILALFGTELARVLRRPGAIVFPHRAWLLANQRPEIVTLSARLAFAGTPCLGAATARRMTGPAPLLRPRAGAHPCPNKQQH